MTLTGKKLIIKNQILLSRIENIKSSMRHYQLDIEAPSPNSQYQRIEFDNYQIIVYETNSEISTQIVTSNDHLGALYIITQALELGAPQLIYVETLHPLVSIDPSNPTVFLNGYNK